MPSIKTNFKIKAQDIERVQEAVIRCGLQSEGLLNDYLHNEAGDMIAQSITRAMPRSTRKKVHAKDKKWYEQINYDLSVGIANKTGGKNSFYYLYYPATGTGTSEGKEPNDFMERGLEKEYNKIVNGMIEVLTKNFLKEMK